MKRVFIILTLFICYYNAFAQGLEDIIVETYYITSEDDAKIEGATAIKANSVTYRIFIDMKPGYKLHSVYGSPGHPMKLSTSTSLYNHAIHGHYIPNLVMVPLLPGDALMLDSWISAGAASQQHHGVVKADDDTLNTIENLSKPRTLQSENPLAGLPIKFKDGLMVGDTLPPRVTQIGLDSLLENLHRAPTSGEGYLFSTINGGWGCLGGASGCDKRINRVLIGQFTTDGDFYFEFNIQIGSAEQGIEQYVAVNPVDKEQLNPKLIISKPSLKYNSNNNSR